MATICAVLGYPRSNFYYQPHPDDDTALRAELERLAAEWPTYGYRRLTAQLGREWQTVNSKRVRRLMRLMRLMPIYQKPDTSKPAKGHKT